MNTHRCCDWHGLGCMTGLVNVESDYTPSVWIGEECCTRCPDRVGNPIREHSINIQLDELLAARERVRAARLTISTAHLNGIWATVSNA